MSQRVINSFAGAAIAAMTASAALAADGDSVQHKHGLEGAQNFYARGSGFVIKEDCAKPVGNSTTCTVLGIDGLNGRAIPMQVVYTDDGKGNVTGIDAKITGEPYYYDHGLPESRLLNAELDKFRARHSSAPITDRDYKIEKGGLTAVEEGLVKSGSFSYSGAYRSIDGFSFLAYEKRGDKDGLHEASCALVPVTGEPSSTGHDKALSASNRAICIDHFSDKANVTTTVTFHAVGLNGLVSSSVVTSKPFGAASETTITEFDIRRYQSALQYLGTKNAAPRVRKD